jgi:hypothetical protein
MGPIILVFASLCSRVLDLARVDDEIATIRVSSLGLFTFNVVAKFMVAMVREPGQHLRGIVLVARVGC